MINRKSQIDSFMPYKALRAFNNEMKYTLEALYLGSKIVIGTILAYTMSTR
jgi:hypothetical protein